MSGSDRAITEEIRSYTIYHMDAEEVRISLKIYINTPVPTINNLNVWLAPYTFKTFNVRKDNVMKGIDGRALRKDIKGLWLSHKSHSNHGAVIYAPQLHG